MNRQEEAQREAGRIAAHFYGQALAAKPGTTLDIFRDHIAQRYGSENWAKLPPAQRADAIEWVQRGKKQYMTTYANGIAADIESVAEEGGRRRCTDGDTSTRRGGSSPSMVTGERR